MAVASRKNWTVEEYLAFERSSETRHEFLDGEVFAMAGASSRHSLIVGALYASLFVQTEARECFVYQSDMRVQVSASGLYTYPDIVALCDTPIFDDRVQDTLLNPSVVIEVLSPSTEAYDRGRKFLHYKSIPTLEAYVLVTQDAPRVEIYLRQPDNTWVYADFTALDDLVSLPPIDCKVSLRRIYTKVQFGDEETPL
jgi:Uma2 family endonuclease